MAPPDIPMTHKKNHKRRRRHWFPQANAQLARGSTSICLRHRFPGAMAPLDIPMTPPSIPMIQKETHKKIRRWVCGKQTHIDSGADIES